MPILLVTLVITHFLTLVAQLQQAGVGQFVLLSTLVETLICQGMEFTIYQFTYSRVEMVMTIHDQYMGQFRANIFLIPTAYFQLMGLKRFQKSEF